MMRRLMHPLWRKVWLREALALAAAALCLMSETTLIRLRVVVPIVRG